ncbi:MAG: hypothetical protein DME22_09960 [Verrucomicrobia bacterium]|nr:MAG: hypothetical protein DME22_09960 [Verrucomicrobiota bacterium]
MKTKQRIEFGDFQTPLPLAREVCAKLKELGVEPSVVVEPTSGVGNFLRAAAEAFPNATLEGLEINEEHLRTASSELKEFLDAGRIRLRLQDFFVFDWDTYLSNLQGQLLMLGNPPWVTNSTVSGLKGSNLPEKQNFLGLRGFAAKTGKSNFDISEWMLIRLLQALRGRRFIKSRPKSTSTPRFMPVCSSRNSDTWGLPKPPFIRTCGRTLPNVGSACVEKIWFPTSRLTIVCGTWKGCRSINGVQDSNMTARQ